jgi:hypothetical protein
MKHLLLSVTLLVALLGYSQQDKYANQALKFAEQIVNSDDTVEVLNLLSDSLKSDSDIQEIAFVRGQFKDNRKRIQFYIVKIEAPTPLYNINLHNPTTLEQFGDFRIHFKNEDDILIDEWLYLPEQDSRKLDGQIKLPENMPPPPPPPPNKK